MGLCPLHSDHKPSFLVDPGKSLFYCYGCGRGGDVIRFGELYHQVKFPQALALLHQRHGLAPLLHQATDFYCSSYTATVRRWPTVPTRSPLAGTD
jgi:DNA primase